MNLEHKIKIIGAAFQLLTVSDYPKSWLLTYKAKNENNKIQIYESRSNDLNKVFDNAITILYWPNCEMFDYIEPGDMFRYHNELMTRTSLSEATNNKGQITKFDPQTLVKRITKEIKYDKT